MEALDLALCLGRRRLLQTHAIESQGGTQLGECVRHVGVKKAVVVHTLFPRGSAPKPTEFFALDQD